MKKHVVCVFFVRRICYGDIRQEPHDRVSTPAEENVKNNPELLRDGQSPEAWAAKNVLHLAAAFRHWSQLVLRGRSWLPDKWKMQVKNEDGEEDDKEDVSDACDTDIEDEDESEDAAPRETSALRRSKTMPCSYSTSGVKRKKEQDDDKKDKGQSQEKVAKRQKGEQESKKNDGDQKEAKRKEGEKGKMEKDSKKEKKKESNKGKKEKDSEKKEKKESNKGKREKDRDKEEKNNVMKNDKKAIRPQEMKKHETEKETENAKKQIQRTASDKCRQEAKVA